jgi:hypothetical protein
MPIPIPIIGIDIGIGYIGVADYRSNPKFGGQYQSMKKRLQSECLELPFNHTGGILAGSQEKIKTHSKSLLEIPNLHFH